MKVLYNGEITEYDVTQLANWRQTLKCNNHRRNCVGSCFGDFEIVSVDYDWGTRTQTNIVRCIKCGFEKEVKDLSAFMRGKGKGQNCVCSAHTSSELSRKSRADGIVFERKLQDIFEKAGYNVERTPDSGDYGVDFITEINGERWAFQCKKKKVPANTHAVLEVYAGGRYHDCTRFCVVSPSGFSYNAKKCAAKLGVQLETEKFRFNLNQESYIAKMLETTQIPTKTGRIVMWELNGEVRSADEWCNQYGITRSTVFKRLKNGMSLQEALVTPKYQGALIEINGVKKAKKEWCSEHGISTQLFDYRVKHGGLSPLEALTKPKMEVIS